jgi:hypothetical protein
MRRPLQILKTLTSGIDDFHLGHCVGITGSASSAPDQVALKEVLWKPAFRWGKVHYPGGHWGDAGGTEYVLPISNRFLLVHEVRRPTFAF